MTIVHTVQGRRILVAVNGDLDLTSAAPLRDALDELLERYRDKALVLDLSDVEFIDSSGLGVILGRFRKMGDRPFSLVGVRPSVKAVLELAGITDLLPVTDATRSVVKDQR
ncbi:MAG: anti-sigma factor antagonist [Sulfobacillus thermosulfidooxidans]|uniref:Anti-sigma factor antagonist n=1 Tax=Sulfobacillus thermotolerans TaxID=338644 RepID=A0ABM6RQC6_9FIRM|nr:STAS domain-containing protein [Sulfobacillus sp. hq2]AUW93624.1 anti-anti-sigma factor [Sulfobacillus thermotolerans]MCY0907030.1 STAS domain-containing protein [Sulfobacillus thermotolerans]POB10867.1 anti-anti-sigma factor [Sulfobacillus sp. hq2]PSR34238.1 MAG: anti-sigma factor antagonist [Sulfobacillus thermosulfidooxidans]